MSYVIIVIVIDGFDIVIQLFFVVIIDQNEVLVFGKVLYVIFGNEGNVMKQNIVILYINKFIILK